MIETFLFLRLGETEVC